MTEPESETTAPTALPAAPSHAIPAAAPTVSSAPAARDYILSIDQGTTSSRAILFDQAGRTAASAQQEFPQLFPHNGWVEHDPNVIWQSVQSVLADLFIHSSAQPSQVAAIGIANQRETTLIWDRQTGLPIYNALVWQSRQSAAISQQLVADGYEDFIHERTGLIIDAYFSATKIRWILDQVPGAQARAEAGQLCFGTVDTWLAWKLTSGKVFATDVTNASRTMLFNLRERDWDDDILRILDIPRAILPEIRQNATVYGQTDPAQFFGESVPIGNLMGDQQAALVGHLAFEEGSVKNTYGTGAFMVMNTGQQPHFSAHKLLTTVAYQLDGRMNYALEGAIFMAGATIQWLRDSLGVIDGAGQTEAMALAAASDNSIYFVPAFTGLGAPYWDAQAKGAVFGLTRGTTKNEIAKAALQGIAYQVKDVLDVMCQDTGVEIPTLAVDGGGSVNRYLMQFQSDLLQVPVVKPVNEELTAFGTAIFAGLAVGFWEDLDQVRALGRGEDVVFKPGMAVAERDRLYANWQIAVAAARAFKL